jgi:predicted dehydrogenase
MRRIKVGVVGVGYLGRFHLEKYSKIDNIELVAIADIDIEKADKVSKEFGCKGFYDYRALFDKVQAVSIAVPTSIHYEVTRDFLLNGIDVLVEKPITTDLEKADELIRISEENGLILQVGHLERFNPAVIAAKNIIKDPMFIESDRLAPFIERGIDVDVILDLMIHDIDIILSFVKSDVKKINSVGVPVITSNVDISNARIEFENGCVANITASRVSREKLRKTRIFQTDSYISIDYVNRDLVILRKIDKDNGFPEILEEKIEPPKADILESEIKSFIDSVITREPPVVSGMDGKRAIEIALKIIEKL